MIWFTEQNWLRFAANNKQTTIRHHELKAGIHRVMIGNRFVERPRVVGSVFVEHPSRVCHISDLNVEDAHNDGFHSLTELLMEITRLNPTLKANTLVYVHPVRVLTVIENGQKVPAPQALKTTIT